ncbi:hypothetical protein BKA58DRAFT_414595 [Alternaria rosae]|uniref:uncharacterized protein n=1 Tax=Alternaria rosae TaxID=1187941 RepID=UPI001E8D43D4|nr:uncharacterized protein BKA58DRAFT_414595 [Alternaria rosae]KAH6858918.1 hypothetical protein BKA58DRAFT_414595 [Alternaria rosae]
MGRGGYNGGSAAVDGPKVDDIYIFTADRGLDADLIQRSRIVDAGFSLKNEHGAVQREFGYLLRVDSVAISTQPSRTSLVKKIFAAFGRRDKSRRKRTSHIKWVSASHLLHTAPGAQMQYGGCAPKSTWRHRQFPPDAFIDDVSKTRVDFDAFINSMDDQSFAYLCLIREYATRALQGKAAEYSGLYQAMVSQNIDEEASSRISTIEFLAHGLRSRTFAAFEEFKSYMDEPSARSDSPFRCLFVLEDMPVRYICLLGSRLRIHPTVFAVHYTTGVPATASTSKVVTKNSTRHVKEEVSFVGIQYSCRMFLPKKNSDPFKCPTWLKPNARLRDRRANPQFVVAKNLETPSKYDQWDARGEISELGGQITYWYHTLSGGGWEGQSESLPC